MVAITMTFRSHHMQQHNSCKVGSGFKVVLAVVSAVFRLSLFEHARRTPPNVCHHLRLAQNQNTTRGPRLARPKTPSDFVKMVVIVQTMIKVCVCDVPNMSHCQICANACSNSLWTCVLHALCSNCCQTLFKGSVLAMLCLPLFKDAFTIECQAFVRCKRLVVV